MEREFKVTEVIQCPVCSNQSVLDIIEKYDDRFGQPDVFFYAHCPKCNTIFLKNKIVKNQMARLYSKYYEKNKGENLRSNFLKSLLEMVRLDKVILQWLAGNILLLEKVRDNASVLEIGSGYSPALKQTILKKKLLWTGLEVDEILVQQIKKDGLSVLQGTVDDLDKMEMDKVDYIVSSQSLEHQFDVNVFFENNRKILNTDGSIIFTTPNVDSRYRKKYGGRWINWHAPYHTTLLSRKSINLLCEKYGYCVVKYFTYTPTSWFMLQSVFGLPSRGQKNAKFNFNFSLLKQLVVSFWLRIFEGIERNGGDCIYCEIRMK